MQFHHLSAIVFTVLVLTVSCKKDEEPTINPCLNGKLDSGETAIDCGGSCGPCATTDFPYASFSANGTSITAEIKQLAYASGWSLHVGNDSVSVQMNFGTNGAVGTYPMSATGCTATYNSVEFPTLASGYYTISQHNTTTHKMNGFFQGKFTRPGSTDDTLVITNGFFESLPY